MEEVPNTMKILEGGTTFRQVCAEISVRVVTT